MSVVRLQGKQIIRLIWSIVLRLAVNLYSDSFLQAGKLGLGSKSVGTEGRQAAVIVTRRAECQPDRLAIRPARDTADVIEVRKEEDKSLDPLQS
jgi:hypothetical protein